MRNWFILGCIIAGTSIGFVNYLLVSMVLMNRVRRIADVAHAVSENDISHECTLVSHDVIGEIVASVNRMTANLRHMLSQISAPTSNWAVPPLNSPPTARMPGSEYTTNRK